MWAAEIAGPRDFCAVTDPSPVAENVGFASTQRACSSSTHRGLLLEGRVPIELRIVSHLTAGICVDYGTVEKRGATGGIFIALHGRWQRQSRYPSCRFSTAARRL
jgi:hypothetical protein